MSHPSSLPRSLLLVEDHELSAMLLMELLRTCFPARDVCRAATAALGFSEFLRLAPALSVIDVSLPDESGVGLVRRMAAANLQAVMVVHSSHDSDVIRHGALAAGALAFVSKKEPAELVRVVGQLLRQASAMEVFPQGPQNARQTAATGLARVGR